MTIQRVDLVNECPSATVDGYLKRKVNQSTVQSLNMWSTLVTWHHKNYRSQLSTKLKKTCSKKVLIRNLFTAETIKITVSNLTSVYKKDLCLTLIFS